MTSDGPPLRSAAAPSAGKIAALKASAEAELDALANRRGELQANSGDVMTDIALILSLQTSVIVSLFTDAQAQPGDAIPDGSSDPRGWWGDMPVDPAAQDAATTPDRTGSRIWLLDRALQTDQTQQLERHYAAEALQWMLDDDEASTITVTASFPAPGRTGLVIEIDESADSTFTLDWQNS